MQIFRYTPDQNVVWDEVIAASRNGTFLHYRGYMDYHAARFHDHSLVIYDKDKAIAVFPCNENGDDIVTHGGLTFGGLIYLTSVHASDVLAIFTAIGDYFRALDKKYVYYKAIPHVFHRYPAEEDLYALFRLNCELYRRDASAVIDLSLRPKLSDSRKNTARKSEKLGVAISDLDDFTEFHELLVKVLAKFGAAPVHSIAELRLLKSRFPAEIKLYGAKLGDELLAAVLVYDYGHVAHTQYMASSDAGRKHGALDYLLISLVEKIYADKKYLSFGISTEEQGRVLNDGLMRQKEGFGGRAVVHDFYKWKI